MVQGFWSVSVSVQISDGKKESRECYGDLGWRIV